MSLYRRFTDSFPSLVTTNAAGRKKIFSSAPSARMFVNVLNEVRRETGVRLLGFVIMPDHVHLVLAPSPPFPLGQLMQMIKGRFARRYNQSIHGSGSVWQSRYHERALRSETELISALEYVDRNPVAAGLSRSPDTYPWSSASGRYQTDVADYVGQSQAEA